MILEEMRRRPGRPRTNLLETREALRALIQILLTHAAVDERVRAALSNLQRQLDLGQPRTGA
jgi:predicted component of type VI protein secretion system